MNRMFARIRALWNERRKRDMPVSLERRGSGKKRRQEVEKRYDDAVADLERTVRMNRDDIFKSQTINDRQQVVIFSSYRAICHAKGPEIGRFQICRHPDHPDAANASLLICDEDKCPRLSEALQGAA